MIKLNRPVCPYPVALTNLDYAHAKNKQALRTANADKCMYCESKIAHVDYGDVEHIKPKAEGKFPEMQYVWDNLGYACSKCNSSKGDKYSSDTPYVDPYGENPEDHIVACGSWLVQYRGSERGELTIKDIALNRPELLEKRLERISGVRRAVDACVRTKNATLRKNALEALKTDIAPDKEFSLTARTAFQQVTLPAASCGASYRACSNILSCSGLPSHF